MSQNGKETESIGDLFEQLTTRIREDFQSAAPKMYDLPRKRGYAEVQQRLMVQNAICSGQIENPFFPERILADNKKEEEVEAFLNWCKQYFHLQTLYYPMCGWHTTPREVFGIDNVVHLSSDDCHPYLEDLEEGLRVKALVQSQPFQERVFDAIYLRGWDIPKKDIVGTFIDFRKVVKDGGIFIIELGNNRNICKYAEKHLQPAEVPENIRRLNRGFYALYRNCEKPPTRYFWQLHR